MSSILRNILKDTVYAGMTPEELYGYNGMVAMNAVNATRTALGRGDQLWLVDDWQRYHAIHELLNGALTVERPSEVLASTDANPLVAPKQAAHDPALAAVERALTYLDDDDEVITRERIVERAIG